MSPFCVWLTAMHLLAHMVAGCSWHHAHEVAHAHISGGAQFGGDPIDTDSHSPADHADQEGSCSFITSESGSKLLASLSAPLPTGEFCLPCPAIASLHVGALIPRPFGSPTLLVSTTARLHLVFRVFLI